MSPIGVDKTPDVGMKGRQLGGSQAPGAHVCPLRGATPLYMEGIRLQRDGYGAAHDTQTSAHNHCSNRE